jgi:hypothetical protein
VLLHQFAVAFVLLTQFSELVTESLGDVGAGIHAQRNRAFGEVDLFRWINPRLGLGNPFMLPILFRRRGLEPADDCGAAQPPLIDSGNKLVGKTTLLHVGGLLCL